MFCIYMISMALYREGVSGIKGKSVPATQDTWNIWEWDLQ